MFQKYLRKYLYIS